jgi:long-chain acyl-CoA synthetase
MFQNNLFEIFKSSALKFENKSAIIFASHHISFQRLLDAIERLASGLKKLGVTAGDSFAIMLPNLPQFVISYYALLKLGVRVVPIDLSFQQDDIRRVSEACQLKGIIALDRFVEQIQPVISADSFCKILVVLGETIPANAYDLTNLIAGSEPLSHDLTYEPESPAAVFYTAGTIGPRKGVVFNQNNLMVQMESTRRALALESRHTIFGLLPFANAFGNIAAMMTPLACGSTVVLFPKYEVQEVAASLNSHSDILLIGPPKMFEEMVQAKNQVASFQNVKTAICTGAHLSDQLRAEVLEKLAIPIIEGYGLTEAGPFVTVYYSDYSAKNGSVGCCNFGYQVRVVKHDGTDADVNEVGEIIVQGAPVMKGYLAASNNSHVFSNGWLRTGDLGKLDEQGYLYFVARQSQRIVKGGFDIYPGEIEAVLSGHPKVKECVVFGVYDDMLNQEVKALVVCKNGEVLTGDELRVYCRDRLPAFKCPKYLEVARSLPPKSNSILPMESSNATAAKI